MTDPSFTADRQGLLQAVEALLTPSAQAGSFELPDNLPENGIGELRVLDQLAPIVLAGAAHLDAPQALAHMDPPTPWISWAMTLWNASLNQNLLHPDVAPVAREIEQRVIDWLAPAFGMDGGHMTPGSTISNLTALWAARELKGIEHVITSDAAHLSVAKAAHILGLKFRAIPCDRRGRMDVSSLPDDLSKTALVLTAGTTSAGAIDDLAFIGRAAWTHVDAAWAGPLRFSRTHTKRLDGIGAADSIAVSAHKWLFQPKESGLIFFKQTDIAHKAISFGGAYLSVPNIGVLGSHGAVAVPLLATLLAWGRLGIEQRIDRSMALAKTLHQRLEEHANAEVFAPPASGVILWRPINYSDISAVQKQLPPGSTSLTRADNQDWLRNVAANPNADIEQIWTAMLAVLA